MPHPSEEGASASAGAPSGSALGRYRIERTLGQGAMGEVLLAHDTLLNRRVALKRMLPEGVDRADRRRTILREARRASSINDAHIASIYDVLDLDDQVVLVMEYVDGVTLRQKMSEPVPIETFWDLASQCVEGLSAAHEHGVIHRDIKPENLMVTRGGLVKILDFGVAKRARGEADLGTTSTDSMAHDIAGTPLYMPPEAHLGSDVDGRADIFALGVVFYELLTARRPFEGSTYAAVVDQVLREAPTPASELNPAVTPALSQLVSRMLAKTPAQRYATPSELLRELNQARAAGAQPVPSVDTAAATLERAVSADVARQPASGRWWRPALAVTAVAVALAVGLAIARWGPLGGPALPRAKNVALLAPRTAGDADFTAFALGAFEQLNTRLRRHTTSPDLQVASFAEGVTQKVATASDARKILGVNLALVSQVEQSSDAYRARLELFETASGRRIAARSVQAPAAQPFLFLDRLHESAAALLGLAKEGRTPFDPGIRGAGTLRFALQGLGRLRSAITAADALGASQDFENACRIEPRSAVARAGLATSQLTRFYLATGDTASLRQSEATAREAVGLDSTRAEAHRALASVLATMKKQPEALVEYRRTSELDPTDDQSRLMVGRLYNRLGQPEREEQVYRDAIARRGHCWQPYWWLATWNFRRGNLDESVRNFREMIRRSPGYYDGYSSLGGVLVLRGDYASAIDTLKRSIELRPSKAAFDNLGTAYFNSGRGQEAVDAYNQSFQFGEADYQTWFNLGEAYLWLQGRDADAAGAYTQAIQLARAEIEERARLGRSVDPMIPASLAVMFAQTGRRDSARVYLRRAVSLDGGNPMVQYHAALTCWQLGEKDQALTWMQKSVQGGYPITWLRDSPIFREWRSMPSFRALIGEANPQSQPAAPSS